MTTTKPVIDPFAWPIGLPTKYGIPGIPQTSGNGGLPVLHTGVISDWGAHRFAPTIQTASVFEYQDNLTRIIGKHEFKFGGQYDHLMSNIIQPAYPRGWFQWTEGYSDIPNASSGDTGMADMVLTPVAANSYYASNGGISSSTLRWAASRPSRGPTTRRPTTTRRYIGVYIQDNWKLTPELTVNLGLRWDYFGALCLG